jgi:hypothetical protein
VFTHFPPDLIVPIPTLETTHMEPTTHDSIQIGARTRHEIELRIRELRARHNPAPKELREVARLEEFLRTVTRADAGAAR